MKWFFLGMCTVWLLLLLFVFDEDSLKQGLFFIGLMVIYLFVDKIEE